MTNKATDELEVVEIVKICETKVWIESDILGCKHVMLQHEGCEPFTWCTFNYDYRYTSNGKIWAAAENMAIALGAVEPIDRKHREWKLTPTEPEEV